MKLLDLIRPLIVRHISSTVDLGKVEIRSLTTDSRHRQRDHLFVCLKGFQTDGHKYVQQALQNGAVAIVAEHQVQTGDSNVPVIVVADTRRALAFLADRFYRSPSQRLRLVGVTGTNGKTTIAYLLDQVLEAAGYKVGRMGTINMKFGQHVVTLENTTPESLDIQRSLAIMVKAGCTHAVIEASSHAIHMGRTRGCNFGTVIFSNLTQDHLDYHGNMEEYRKAKGLIFAQLGNLYAEADLKYAILNADDDASKEYAALTPAQIITYGIDNPAADILASEIELTARGSTFTVEGFAHKVQFYIPLLGKFNVYNALGVISAGFAEGLSLAQMQHSLQHVQGIPGRMEPVKAGQDFTIIVDYAHTPDSLANVLQTLGGLTEGRLLCIVGCGGERDRQKRPLMAQAACQYADLTFFTSDNPRSEEPMQIIQDMVAGLNLSEVSQTKYKITPDRKQAIEQAIHTADRGDILLIAGKGHETYQQIGQQMIAFDDRNIAAQIVRSMK